MPGALVLASSSAIRRSLLANAGLDVVVDPARIDEETVRVALMAEGYSARDLADALAEAKAMRVAGRHADSLCLGADQTLECEGRHHSKAETPEAAADQLRSLSGKTHLLHSAAVICEDGRPVWRHIGTVRMTMRPLAPDFIDSYVDRNWESVRHSVGCYKIEEEGVRLFSKIEGSHFAILGLPLIELLTYLHDRGVLTT